MTQILSPTRVALAGIAVAVSANVAPAQASQQQAGSWCVIQPLGVYDCSFYSYEQCMETARGLQNICSRNPAAPDITAPAPPTRRSRR